MKRTLALLQAAYSVCRHLLDEQDLPALLQGVCDRLTAGGLNRSALLVLVDREGDSVIAAEAGHNDRAATVMAELRAGRFPDCGLRALAAEDGRARLCADGDCTYCTVGPGRRATRPLCAPVRVSPTVAGFLLLQPPDGVRADGREQQLAGDLGESLARALRRLFAAEAAGRREQELRRSGERCELALQATDAGVWDWNIQTGDMYASPDHWQLLDYRRDDPASVGRAIHPEDRERVLAVLADHLEGRSDEYRIEYRVANAGGGWSWYLDHGRVVERDTAGMPVRMTGTHRDITARKRQDEAVALVQRQLHETVDRERDFLQTIIDSAADPVMAIGLDYELLLINQAAARLVHDHRLDRPLRGSKCHQLFADSYRPCRDSRFPCPVRAVQAGGRPVRLVHNPLHGNGVNNTFELEASPLFDADGRLYGVIEVARDITDRLRIEEELRASQSHLYRLAHHDSLTGLPNRLLFRDRLDQAVVKAQRRRSRVAVLFLDLDRFKTINDTLGHDVGDALLVEVAGRLQRQCRQSDTVARLGGDEFVFVLDDIARAEDAAVVAAKILASLERPVTAAGRELAVATSIGIALYPDHAATADELIKYADRALYTAKDQGRGRFLFYREDLPGPGSRPRIGAEALRRALAGDQLAVDYLPRFAADAAPAAPLQLAALVRWRHPELGDLPADEWLAAAGECGLLAKIDEWIVERVCADLRAWREAGCRLVPVVLALTPHQLLEPGFLPMLERLCARHAVPPSLVAVELAERVLNDACGQGRGLLHRLGELGFGLGADEVGAGLCHPARLQELPLCHLGLSRTLTAAVREDAASARLTAALAGFGHSLGLRVLAVEVGHEAQLDLLRRCGCDLVQGDLLAPALTAAEVAARLGTGEKAG
jgi:diguanylate cyclase (GGDEF)-like protein/PAS domain S-box-containing protein